MATLPVPRYLAQTAARDPAVGEWLGCLAVKHVWSREWQRRKAGTRKC